MKKTVTFYQSYGLFLVEMTRVELVSENIFTSASTGVGYILDSPHILPVAGVYITVVSKVMILPETREYSRSPLGIRLNKSRGPLS